jgi:hypothetical protein
VAATVKLKERKTELAIVATFPTTKRFVVETAFEAYRLFRRTNELRFEIVATFRVPTLAVVAKRLVLEREFGA